ncbi:hypothetical protein L7E55_09690 [Pelotomaculum isophthalicicum JI]|uniref:Uncharacterized protein n=1 Tax=Pelotomaculum isophthalicicum JI TaxID=947010 RepID=A0A9X4H6P6_9FIRM|nr:hypothetical protein [Pelotomaculum isophthalicicum]MDF9408624.1 hypothetical protein [Pelotomaculum isophthalicicum JI]
MVNWNRIYNLLDDITPLAVNCGLLCGSACCTEWEQGAGIYLLPGEEGMFSGLEEWLVREERSTGEYGVIIRCNGTCPRERRPFACRTFPVTPYLSPEGKLELRLDEAAVLLCPLVKAGDIRILEKRFLMRTRLAWEELLREPQIRKNIEWKSRQVDIMEKDPWRKLLEL